MFTQNDDSDMKIAPEFPLPKATGDRAEEVAAEFLRNRENGNIKKARILGTELAKDMLVFDREVGSFVTHPSAVFSVELKLLFAFCVMSVPEKNASNLVSHTLRGSFFDFLGEKAPYIYDAVTDSAAMSLYKIAEENGMHAVTALFEKRCAVGSKKNAADYETIVKTCYDRVADAISRTDFEE